MRYLSLLLAIIFIGCSQKVSGPIVKTVTVTKIVVHKENVPKQFLVSTPIPKVPKNIKLQSQVAGYIIDLYESAKSCKENLKSIKEWNK